MGHWSGGLEHNRGIILLAPLMMNGVEVATVTLVCSGLTASTFQKDVATDELNWSPAVRSAFGNVFHLDQPPASDFPWCSRRMSMHNTVEEIKSAANNVIHST